MPLELLEDAFHLLRQLPASAWLVYFAGAVPFFLAALFCGVEAASAGYTPGRAILESFLCAALFIWMQAWKARFAAIMRAQLSVVPTPPWTVRGIALQCSLQSVKLFAVPFAGLILIPFAWTVSYFRNVTSLALEPDLSAREVLSALARFATSAQRASWIILSILTPLAVAVFLDIAIVLAVLPSLLRSFTGMENAFTRGTGSILNFTFFATSAGLTWLVLDPLLQAVSSRLCFEEQSRHSGADLLAGLRRLAPVLVLIAICGIHAQAAVTPAKLEQSIDKVLQQRPYAWKAGYGQEPGAPATGMLGRLANNIASAGKWMNELFQDVKHWIQRMLKLQPEHSPDTNQAPSRAPLRWTIYALLAAIAVGLVTFLIRSRVAPAPVSLAGASAPIDLSGAEVIATDLPEDRWIAMAHECLERGEYRLALRALYLATLSHLGDRQLVTVQKSKTNRDYERELRRRSRSVDLLAPFHANLLSFECSWYGDHPVAEHDVQAFERNFAAIRTNREA